MVSVILFNCRGSIRSDFTVVMARCSPRMSPQSSVTWKRSRLSTSLSSSPRLASSRSVPHGKTLSVLSIPKPLPLLATRSSIVYVLTIGSLAPGNFTDTVNDPVKAPFVITGPGASPSRRTRTICLCPRVIVTRSRSSVTGLPPLTACNL